MLTLAGTDGITYAADPPGPYAAGQSVTVAATLDPSGVAWPEQLPPAWPRASDTTATYAVTFENVSCHLGAPVAPTVIQATCVGGAVSLPEIVLPRSFGIAYSLDPAPPYDPTIDTQVTVTATTLDGYGWDPMPPGWTQLDSYEATFVVTLYGTSCDEVNPVSPAVTQAICAAGGSPRRRWRCRRPTGSRTRSTGRRRTDPVSRERDGDAGHHRVGWPPTMPPGWTVTSDVTATSSVTFDDKDCKPVPLEAPAVGAASCVDGVLTLPTITLSQTTGLVYVVEPAGSTVTASLVEGFTWDASGPVGFRGPHPGPDPPVGRLDTNQPDEGGLCGHRGARSRLRRDRGARGARLAGARGADRAGDPDGAWGPGTHRRGAGDRPAPAGRRRRRCRLPPPADRPAAAAPPPRALTTSFRQTRPGRAHTEPLAVHGDPPGGGYSRPPSSGRGSRGCRVTLARLIGE